MRACVQERAKLVAAMANARVNPMHQAVGQLTQPRVDLPEVEEVQTTTPLELLVATGLELILEFSTKYITLGPLYVLTQPFAVLKTRAHYRMVQTAPAPRIAEVDSEGNEIAPPAAAFQVGPRGLLLAVDLCQPVHLNKYEFMGYMCLCIYSYLSIYLSIYLYI